MTTIRTEQLVLRLPRVDDADAITLHLSDFEVAGNLARVRHPYARADAIAWLLARPASPVPNETAFIIDTADGAMAGNVGFHERREGVADVGYYLGRPFWGRGLMTEALTAALDWYFAETDAPAVGSGVFHFNAASLAIQRKLGFVEIGRSQVHCLARGEDIEHVDTELSRAAFAALER
jgi:RimJ/RimL family protein N-acetyltransferase